MTSRLGDRTVTDGMWHTAKDIKARGGKVYLIVGPDSGKDCTNCNGHEWLHLEIMVGGPYDYMPDVKPKNDDPITVTWLNDGWYKSKKLGFRCPVCNAGQAVSGYVGALVGERPLS